MAVTIFGTKGLNAADKAKKSGRSGTVGSSSFETLLAEAQGAMAAGEVAQTGLSGGLSVGFLPIEPEAPRTQREQADQLLTQLDKVVSLGLMGDMPDTTSLKALVELNLPLAELSPQQAEGIADVQTRAAVEVEKLAMARRRA